VIHLLSIVAACIVAAFAGFWFLTRQSRSCRRQTCSYYVRYITRGEPLLTHSQYHQACEDREFLWKDIDNYAFSGYPLPPSLLEQLKNLDAKIRYY
jgi:hypothetical protein